jgi:hypothetical protein
MAEVETASATNGSLGSRRRSFVFLPPLLPQIHSTKGWPFANRKEERTMSKLNQAINGVKSAAHSAGSSAEHAAKIVRNNWLDGVRAITGVAMLLRSFGTKDVLGLIGLQRRGNPLARAGSFGVGLTLGLGAGLLLAPASGKETRRMLRSRLTALMANTDTKQNGIPQEEHITNASQNMVSEGGNNANA